MTDWINQAISRIEADFKRSSDTHYFAKLNELSPIQFMPGCHGCKYYRPLEMFLMKYFHILQSLIVLR